MSQDDEGTQVDLDASWVADVVDRLASTSQVGYEAGSVSPSAFRRLCEYLANDLLVVPRLTRAVEGMAGHRHPLTAAVIRPGDLLPVQIAKYVKHALDDGEWDPDVTDLHSYLWELAETVSHDGSDVYLELDAGHWKLTFGRDWPADAEGEELAYTVVSFLPVKGLWLTGFRPDRGRAYISARGADHQGRWIKVQR